MKMYFYKTVNIEGVRPYNTVLAVEMDSRHKHLFTPKTFRIGEGINCGSRTLAQKVLDTNEKVYFKNGNELDCRKRNLTTKKEECKLPEGTKPHDRKWDWLECYHKDHKTKINKA